MGAIPEGVRPAQDHSERDHQIQGILSVSHGSWLCASVGLSILLGRRFEPLMVAGFVAYITTALVSGRRRFGTLTTVDARARLRESTGIALAMFAGGALIVGWLASDVWIASAGGVLLLASGALLAGSLRPTTGWFRRNWIVAALLWGFVALIADGAVTAEDCNRLYRLGYHDLPRCEPDPGDAERGP